MAIFLGRGVARDYRYREGMTKKAKGAGLIFAAKLIFLFNGYALYFLLSRLLSTESFGVYGVLFAVVSLLNMIVVNGTLQTASHFVASRPDRGSAIYQSLFKLQSVIMFPLLLAFLAAAPLLAEYLQNEALTELFRLAASITLAYGFYAIQVGYINGHRQFHQQALLDILFSLLKVSLIGLFVYLGYGLPGVILGFFLTVVALLLASTRFTPRPWRRTRQDPFVKRDYLRFAGWIVGVVVLQNLVLNLDLLILKHLSPASTSDKLAGFYTASQSIARIPYYLLTAYSLILFPSFASMKEDSPKMRAQRAEISSRALIATICLLSGMIAVTAPISAEVLTVLYPERFLPAAPSLMWLLIGIGFFALANVINSLISGYGQPRLVLVFLLFACVAQVVCAYVLIPVLGIEGAAMATGLAGLFACLPGAFWIVRRFKTRAPVSYLMMIVITTVATCGIARFFPAINPIPGKLGVLITLAVGFSFHVGVLALFGVITGAGAGLAARRILWVTKPLEPPFNDGSKVYLKNLLAEFTAWPVTVCFSAKGRDQTWLPDTIETAPVYASGRTFGGQLLQNARIFGYLLLNRRRYGVIHFFFAPNRMSCLAVRFLKRISPSISFLQTVMSRPESFENVGSALFGDVVFASSEDTARRLANAAPKTKIILARPGIADDPAPESTALGGTERFNLLFAGDVEEGGALANLARIMPDLLRRNPWLHFHFSVRLKTPAARTAAETWVRDNLRELEGRLSLYFDHEPFDDLLRLQDAMIFPSEHLYKKVDAPFVILESMALGKPVFLLDRSPVNETCPPALQSQLMASEPEDLSRLIEAFAKNPETIDGAMIVDFVQRHFSARLLGRAYEEFYRGFV